MTDAEPWTSSMSRLSGLATGWDSYDAQPPNETALSNLAAILREVLLQAVPLQRVVPSVEGGAGVVFGTREVYADIECFNDGSVLAITSLEGAEPKVWELAACDPPTVSEAVAGIGRFLKENGR